MQHARLIAAKGFHGVNRVHFTLGILAYLASPLWLAFLTVSAVAAWRSGGGGVRASFADYAHWSYLTQAVSLSVFTLVMLFLPKVLALLDLRRRPEEIKAFGGWDARVGGVLLETFIFTLLAPVLMLFHTIFVVLTLAGRKIWWVPQRRGAAGEAMFSESVRAHWVHNVIGFAGWILVDRSAPALAFWMTPIFADLICSIPLSFFRGSLAVGRALRAKGLFVTPEESNPAPELAEIEAALAGRRPTLPPADLAENYGLMQAVLDPYVNAVHGSLLRAKDELPPASEERFCRLAGDAPAPWPGGPECRRPARPVMDADSMNALHDTIWASLALQLAGWWQRALEHYNVVAPAPKTALFVSS